MWSAKVWDEWLYCGRNSASKEVLVNLLYEFYFKEDDSGGLKYAVKYDDKIEALKSLGVEFCEHSEALSE